MIRKRHIPLLLALLLLLLPACGAGNADVDMTALQESMADAAPSLPQMLSVTDADENAGELFSYLSDMDYGKVSRFFLLYAASGDADEIAVIEVKNRADAADAEQSLRAHLVNRARLYEQYRPDQLQRVEQAEVFVRGRWAVLIVCDEAAAVKAAFDRAIG